MFKKLVVGAILFGNSVAALAGEYDGVWQISGDTSYNMIYSDATGLAVMVTLDLGSSGGLYGEWSATGIGTLSGNVLSGNLDRSARSLSASVTFSGPNTGTLIIKSCSAKILNGCSGVRINTPFAFNRIL